jgi:hypothetical protein
VKWLLAVVVTGAAAVVGYVIYTRRTPAVSTATPAAPSVTTPAATATPAATMTTPATKTPKPARSAALAMAGASIVNRTQTLSWRNMDDATFGKWFESGHQGMPFIGVPLFGAADPGVTAWTKQQIQDWCNDSTDNLLQFYRYYGDTRGVAIVSAFNLKILPDPRTASALALQGAQVFRAAWNRYRAQHIVWEVARDSAWAAAMHEDVAGELVGLGKAMLAFAGGAVSGVTAGFKYVATTFAAQMSDHGWADIIAAEPVNPQWSPDVAPDWQAWMTANGPKEDNISNKSVLSYFASIDFLVDQADQKQAAALLYAQAGI